MTTPASTPAGSARTPRRRCRTAAVAAALGAVLLAGVGAAGTGHAPAHTAADNISWDSPAPGNISWDTAPTGAA
ncbi:hypothetical protein [Streptomyces sp. NPDC047028]|uniref:hypothetical protein n=1 Tax=Streptomyces sp. NPDC047028 TaxID=3155793 RepID=UPI0033DD9D51